MTRNLDIATLRSLIAIGETGGMTRAANRLHLTQSAVSMQVKRLEELLPFKIFERVGRTMQATPEGKKLIDYARQLVALNDDAIDQLTTPLHEGSINFGVPYDIVHPHVPTVLTRFGREYPRMAVRLNAEGTRTLLQGFDEGRYDVILTTERKPSRKGEVLMRQRLVWTGAPEGRVWRSRPMPLAFTKHCMFREPAVRALNKAGIEWVNAVDTNSEDAAVVSCAADLGLRVDLTSSRVQGIAPIEHGGVLPELPEYCVALYVADGVNSEIASLFGDMLSAEFQTPLLIAV